MMPSSIIDRAKQRPFSRGVQIGSPRQGRPSFAKLSARSETFGVWGTVLLIGAVVVFVQEGSGLLPWLFGGFAPDISKLLKLSLWFTAGCVLSLRIGKSDSLAQLFRWALLLGAVTIGISLLGGSSLGAILTELMFIPIVILTMMVAVHRAGRRILVGILIFVALINLFLTLAPPDSYTAIKINSAAVEYSYGAVYMADVEDGSRFTGLFLYPSVSGALSLVGYQLVKGLPLAAILCWPLRLACLFGSLISLQRSVYLGLAGSFVASFHLSGTTRIPSGIRILRLAANVAVLVVALVIVWNFIPTPMTKAIQYRLSRDKFSSDSEIRLYSQWGVLTGLKAIMAAPILGSSKGKYATGAEGRFVAPHNMLIFVGAKYGLPVIIIFTLLLVNAFQGLRRYARLTAHGEERIWAVALLQSFVGVAIVLMFQPGYGPLFFWVVAGIGLAFSQNNLTIKAPSQCHGASYQRPSIDVVQRSISD